jgi:hypothetical protein
MNGNTGANRGLRRAGALAAMATVAVLATGCGVVHVHVGSSGGSAGSAGSATFRANLAFAHCMQTHGVPDFPEPANSSESFHVSGRPNGKLTGSLAQASDVCEHLLPRGSTTTGGSSVTQAQLDLALKIVQCLRTHGAPDFPDPTVVNGSLHFSVDIQSAQLQAPLNACRSLIPKGIKLP